MSSAPSWAPLLNSAPLAAAAASHPNSDVRLAVAANRRTSPTVLTELARDPSQHVRRAVASNPSTSVDALTRFATHPNPLTRRHLACRNAQLPEAFLDLLSVDPDGRVRAAMAQRKDLTEEHRILLALGGTATK
jgi:hypothetical protein